MNAPDRLPLYTRAQALPGILRQRIAILHGPNLNRLGKREPEIYGSATLADLEASLRKEFSTGVELEFFQSNHEGALIDRIHACLGDGTDLVIINPAAFTHTSVALRDALAGVKVPFIEVHLSNVHAREAFRHHSYFSDLAIGVICGLGAHGYELALAHAIKRLAQPA